MLGLSGVQGRYSRGRAGRERSIVESDQVMPDWGKYRQGRPAVPG